MEFLKEILGEELYSQLEEKINAYNGNEENKDKQIKLDNIATGKYVSQLKYGDLETQLKGKGTELETANKLIEELRKSTKSDEELQKKIKEYEGQIEDLQAENAQNKLKYALKDALRNAKAVDTDYLCYVLEKSAKESGESIELDDDGNVKGWDDKLKELKVQCPNMFESGESNKHVHENKLPDQNHDGGTTEPKNLADAIRMKFEKKE